MILQARSTFHAATSGHPRLVQAGDLVDSSDPVVKGREALFVAADDLIEQATAAPGEKRSIVRKATKKAAAKPKPADD